MQRCNAKALVKAIIDASHVTPDLGGRYRLGPDVEWVDAPRYDVDPAKAGRFAETVARYLPELRAEHLSPDFAGVRPKLQRPEDPFRDFWVEEASDLGAPAFSSKNRSCSSVNRHSRSGRPYSPSGSRPPMGR